jgi:hypothetical protein
LHRLFPVSHTGKAHHTNMSSDPSYSQSLAEAKGHGKAFLQSTIGAHPMATAVVIAVLVLLVLVLGYWVMHYRAELSKAGGFRVGIAPYNNLNINGNNPMWYLGSMDAGNWGPMHRDATAYNVAAYEPSWRGDAMRGQQRREGLHNGSGGGVFPQVGPAVPCARGWDPAASAEAQALATVGALPHDGYAESKLQGAVDGAFDSGASLNDEQLTALMHSGDAM